MTDIRLDTSPHIPLKRRKALEKAAVAACLCSWLSTALILLIDYVLIGFMPFGQDALLYKDGQQQMIDLYCWFKDVLSGRSSISYTFTKYLGGSNFAVFSYYLSSPLNLLILFFDKSQVSLFMNVLYLLKASFAALFACCYLLRRFNPQTKTKYIVTVLLSVSFALSQYMISQSTNMMWLDGVYMLPLILEGVEILVSRKKSTLFIISVALALCFNWYTGIIDLMFAGIWFLFESCRVAVTAGPVPQNSENSGKKGFRSFLMSFLRFCVSSLCAGMLSAVILLPSLTLLQGRTYGSSGIGMLLDLSMIGFVPNVISNYCFGLVCIKGSANLFAGSFVLIGVVLLFVSSSLKLKEKLVYGIFLLFVILAFYWQPLVALFSMLRTVDVFWYRYSYIGSFTLVYLAAVFYLESDTKKMKLFVPPAIAAAYCVIAIFMADPGTVTAIEANFTNKMSEILMISPDYHLVPLISQMVFPVATSLLICLAAGLNRSKSSASVIGQALLSFILIAELTLSQMVLAKTYSTGDGPAIDSYTAKEIELLGKIEDDSFHRAVQTTYHSQYHGLGASYSEPMAYGFNSVTAFVSAPEENAVYFLDRAGYPQYYDTIPVTVSENLALDSLLSVKYVILPSGDDNNAGLQKISGIDGFKDLYLNPYAAPAAFVINRTGSYESSSKVPCQYLNDLYRDLSGIEKNIFVKIPSENITAVSADEDGKPVYSYVIKADDPGAVMYANLVTNTDKGAMLYLNGKESTPYSEEMAPSMVRIKAEDGTVQLKLAFKAEQSEVTDAQFYVLDTKALEEAISVMRNNAAQKSEIHDGHCVFEIGNASAGSSLFTSVPYNKGWTITRNGKKVESELTGNVFITIPLEEGQNVITMDYNVPHIKAGAAASAAGLIFLVGIALFENKKRTVSN